MERTDTDYEIKKAEDEDRDDVIEQTAKTISGDTEKCEDKDKKHKCYEYCDDMFRSNRDEEDCEELTVAQVEAMWELYELLEDPDADELEDINSEVFDLYLNISIKSLDDLIGKYSRSDAKEFLIWLINNEEAAKIFRKEDDNHKSLEALLKKFSGSYTSSGHDISQPFLKKLDRDKLIEEAMGSELILEWFQDYINEKNSACKSDAETRACFAVYCKIGNGMDDDEREDWLDSGDFESYIEDIIEEKVNSRQGVGDKRNASGWIHEDASGSNSNEIGDVRDIDDNWVDDLCQGLTGGTVSGGGNSGNNNNNDNSDNDDSSDDSSDDDSCGNSDDNNQQPTLPSRNPSEQLPAFCRYTSGVKTDVDCINNLISPEVGQGDTRNIANAKEALSWIFADAERAAAFLEKAKTFVVHGVSLPYQPFKKFFFNFSFKPSARATARSFNADTANIHVAFVEDVRSGKNLMELALDTNTQSHIIDYIRSKDVCSSATNTGWGKGVNVKCFRDVYCAIAHYGGLSPAYLKKWLDTPNFKTYLKKLLKTANGQGKGKAGKQTIRNSVIKAGLPDPLKITDTCLVENWKTRLCRLDEL